MSIRVMSAVWEVSLPATEKLVLLALADCANDEGGCWPSATTIARKCGQGERTVRRAVQSLIAQGHLTQVQRTGTSPIYTVHPCRSGTPANAAPLPDRPDTPANAAPKPSGTVNSKKDKPSSRSRAKHKFELPPEIPGEQWLGFEEMRRRIGKPLTDYARGLAVMRLLKLAEDGWPPGEVLNHSILNNYQGLFPPKDQRNGRQQQLPSLRGSRPSPALDLARRGAALEAAAAEDAAPDRRAWPALPSGLSG